MYGLDYIWTSKIQTFIIACQLFGRTGKRTGAIVSSLNPNLWIIVPVAPSRTSILSPSEIITYKDNLFTIFYVFL